MNGSDREETLFVSALTLPAEQRLAYLDEACGGDADLFRRVAELLEAHEGRGRFMEAPAAPAHAEAAAIPLLEKPGDRVGRYKLMEQIGEGGCGIVYVAEQEEPVRRRVALKVLKLGMDTRDVIARFEAERQALALMDHPGIAKVFDAGPSFYPFNRTGIERCGMARVPNRLPVLARDLASDPPDRDDSVCARQAQLSFMLESTVIQN